MIQYTIHEVAALLNISTDAIRLYEKEGLVTPTRNPENGYRYYSHLQYDELETILTAILFSMIGYFNGSGKTVFVMAQGLFQTLLVRLPMAYIMSIQPNASLTMIGLAAPTSTAVGVLLNVCFFLYLNRKEKKQG